MVEIREVTTKKEVRKFAKYPVELYKGCPYYVPSVRGDELNTFNPKKNASLSFQKAKGFLAYKDGKLVGRIAGIINPKDNANSGVNAIRFSRLECIDDIEVFESLLLAVEKMGKENGMDVIHGPWGFNDTDREGMLTYGFDKRSTYATNYYYPYFAENLRKLGYKDESKWIERRFLLPDQPYDRILRLSEKIKQRYHLKDIAETMPIKEIISKYGYKLFDAYNETYGHLDGFVKVEKNEIDDILSQFATIVNDKYISILVNEEDRVVGFGIALPSICDPLVKSRGKLFPFGFIGVLKAIKKPKELELALIGVSGKYKNSGIHAIIISRIMQNVYKDGIKRVETNPMLEHNLEIQHLWDQFDTEVIKRRQTYVKKID